MTERRDLTRDARGFRRVVPLRLHRLGPCVTRPSRRSEQPDRAPPASNHRTRVRARHRRIGPAPQWSAGLSGHLVAIGMGRLKHRTMKRLGRSICDPQQADGFIKRTRSATLDAVKAFQARNGLKPDRDLGGVHSLTRAALNRSAAQLRRAP